MKVKVEGTTMEMCCDESAPTTENSTGRLRMLKISKPSGTHPSFISRLGLPELLSAQVNVRVFPCCRTEYQDPMACGDLIEQDTRVPRREDGAMNIPEIVGFGDQSDRAGKNFLRCNLNGQEKPCYAPPWTVRLQCNIP